MPRGRGRGRSNPIPHVDWWECPACSFVFSTAVDPDIKARDTDTEECSRCGDPDAILLLGDKPLI